MDIIYCHTFIKIFNEDVFVVLHEFTYFKNMNITNEKPKKFFVQTSCTKRTHTTPFNGFSFYQRKIVKYMWLTQSKVSGHKDWTLLYRSCHKGANLFISLLHTSPNHKYFILEDSACIDNKVLCGGGINQ